MDDGKGQRGERGKGTDVDGKTHAITRLTGPNSQTDQTETLQKYNLTTSHNANHISFTLISQNLH